MIFLPCHSSPDEALARLRDRRCLKLGVLERPNAECPLHGRLSVRVQRHELLCLAIRVECDHLHRRIEDRWRTSEAIAQHTGIRCRIRGVKVHDTAGIRVAERVDALVVIARDEKRGAGMRHEQMDELLVARVEVLILVHDEVLNRW